MTPKYLCDRRAVSSGDNRLSVVSFLETITYQTLLYLVHIIYMFCALVGNAVVTDGF